MPAFDYAAPFADPPEREGPESLLAAAIRAEEARREAFDLAMIEYERGLEVWEDEAVTEPDDESQAKEYHEDLFAVRFHAQGEGG